MHILYYSLVTSDAVDDDLKGATEIKTSHVYIVPT